MIESYDLSFLNLTKVKSLLDSISTTEHGLTKQGSSSYNHGMPILDHPELVGLKKIVLKYINQVSDKPLKLINSWFNIMPPGAVLKRHKHEDSIISGALYVDVGDKSVPLIFDSISIKPKKGLLVLFSSDLAHYTKKEKEERTVISFNTDYEL